MELVKCCNPEQLKRYKVPYSIAVSPSGKGGNSYDLETLEPVFLKMLTDKEIEKEIEDAN